VNNLKTPYYSMASCAWEGGVAAGVVRVLRDTSKSLSSHLACRWYPGGVGYIFVTPDPFAAFWALSRTGRCCATLCTTRKAILLLLRLSHAAALGTITSQLQPKI